MKLERYDLIIGILVTVMWGCNFVVIELGLQELDPFALTFLRFLFCAFPAIFFVKKPQDVSWLAMCLYGIIFGCGLWWTVNFAMYNGLSAGMSSLFLQFSAFFTIALSYLFFKEKVSLTQFLGAVISFIGLSMVIFFTSEKSTLIGIMLVLLASIAWAVCNLIVKTTKPKNMLAFIIWTSLFSAPAVLVMTLITKGFEPFANLDEIMNAKAWFSVLFQAYITTILGYMAWNNLMKKYPATSIAPLSLLVPISGIFSSWLFFSDVITVDKGISMFVVLVGLAIFINSARITAIFNK